jgi:hypothetical protein
MKEIKAVRSRRHKLHLIQRAYRTIDSCKTEANIENAIIYCDTVLRELFDRKSPEYAKWEGKIADKLNARALIVCGVVEED